MPEGGEVLPTLPSQFLNERIFDVKVIPIITKRNYELGGLKLLIPLGIERDASGKLVLHFFLEFYLYEAWKTTPSYYVHHYFKAEINIGS